MTTIILADDHPLVRQGVRTALEAEPGWQVIAEAADGLAAVELVCALRPDVLVVDLMMPNLNGLAVIQRLMEQAAHTAIIVFSMHADDAYVREALAAGARAYVLKESDATELVQAVRDTLAGQRYVSRALTARLINHYVHTPESILDWGEMLTARERQVLQLAAQGLSNAEIGVKLVISPRTAETHRANLMRKLGLRTQAELIRYAAQHGLTGPT